MEKTVVGYPWNNNLKGRKILLHMQLNITVSGSVLIQCIAELLFEEKSIRLTRLHSCWHVEKPWQEEMIKFSDPFSQPNHPLDSTTVWKPRPKIHFESVAKILVRQSLVKICSIVLSWLQIFAIYSYLQSQWALNWRSFTEDMGVPP